MWLSILGLLLVIADSSPRFDCTLKTINELVFGRQILSDPPRLNPARSQITGTVCGVRVETIEEPVTRQIRYLDKLVDELAKGRPMAKILRD